MNGFVMIVVKNRFIRFLEVKMSKMALQNVPRPAKGTTRLVICEEVFDYTFGDAFIAVCHPVSGASFMFERKSLDMLDTKAVRKAIYSEARKHVTEMSVRKKIRVKLNKHNSSSERLY